MHPSNTASSALQASYIESQGLQYAFVGGTTTEGFALSPDERASVIAAYWKAFNGRVKVIAHVAYEAVTSARFVAAAAAATGCVAIAVAPTVLAPPASAEAAVEWMAHIAEACPGTPMLYYHRPAKFGESIRPVDIIRYVIEQKEAGKLPAFFNFAGVKFCDENIQSFADCMLEASKYNEKQSRSAGQGGNAAANGSSHQPHQPLQIIPAMEGTMISAWALGARGFMGGAAAHSGRLMSCIIDALQKGDIQTAGRLHVKLMSILSLLNPPLEGGYQAYGLSAAYDIHKVMLELRLERHFLTGDSSDGQPRQVADTSPSSSSTPRDLCGPPRPPYKPMEHEKRESLRSRLQLVGFFDEQ